MTVNADVAQMFASLFDDSKGLLVEKELKWGQRMRFLCQSQDIVVDLDFRLEYKTEVMKHLHI